MGRQLLLLLVAFAAGTAAAGALGAGLGAAFAVGQICFASMLAYVLLRGRSRGSTSPDNSGEGPGRHSPDSS